MLSILDDALKFASAAIKLIEVASRHQAGIVTDEEAEAQAAEIKSWYQQANKADRDLFPGE